MNKIPRYEKVDNHTIQVIVEKATNLDLAGLIKGREQVAQQIKDLSARLKNIDDVIVKAKELGIVPKVDTGKKKPAKEGRGEKPNTPKPKDAR